MSTQAITASAARAQSTPLSVFLSIDLMCFPLGYTTSCRLTSELIRRSKSDSRLKRALCEWTVFYLGAYQVLQLEPPEQTPVLADLVNPRSGHSGSGQTRFRGVGRERIALRGGL